MSKAIVIDSSVAIKWVVPEDGTREALAIRSKYAVIAPDLIVSEMSNILWKKHRRREIGPSEALVAAELLLGAGIELTPTSEVMLHATDLAIRLEHPAYDCIYLAAAARFGCEFVTADASLVRKLQQQRFKSVPCRHLLAAGVS